MSFFIDIYFFIFGMYMFYKNLQIVIMSVNKHTDIWGTFLNIVADSGE